MCPAYDSEIAFLTGVDDSNKVAPTSYFTWNTDVPATYGTSSTAIKWGADTPGTPGGNVTYSFQASSNWTADEQAVWKAGFGLWAAVANITFSEASDPGTAHITIERGTDGTAYATFGPQLSNVVGSSVIATPNSTGSLISIDTNAGDYGPLGLPLKDKGGAPYSTVMQEIGHIIGLGNGGPYSTAADADAQQFGPYDSQLWTAMSAVAPGDVTAAFYKAYPVTDTDWGKIQQAGVDYANQPMTPMMLDILAIQRLYGASTSDAFDGNDTFGFNSTITGDIGKFYDFSLNPDAIVTLWDSGTNNTLDLSGYSEDAVVNLTPGTFSGIGGHINNLGIAVGTVIETAIGGSGNDHIAASSVASKLQGGAGNDTLVGGTGIDDLQGNAGNDYLDGGAGGDTLSGGAGDNFFDFKRGEANGDTVTDFASGDSLQFFGYGFASQGATFTQVDATHWSINSADDAVHDVVTFSNAPTIAPSDVTFLPEYETLDHSSYLDFLGYRISDATSVQEAYGIGSDYTEATTAGFNVAIVLQRDQDPTSLLKKDWGTRQKRLAELEDDGTLWTTYGADQANYDKVRNELKDQYVLTLLDESNASTAGNYVSSAESRTIWVSIDTAEQFSRLFQTTLYTSTEDGPSAFWLGNLSLPKEWGIEGLFIDTYWDTPNATMLADGSQTLTPGPLGIGNASPNQPDMDPNLIAGLYNFPLNNPANYDGDIKTAKIGLIEPGIGSALPTSSGDPDAAFQKALADYLLGLGITGDGKVHTQGVDGQSWAVNSSNASERSLDVGVVAAVNPNSDIILYNGSGANGHAKASVFTATQSAIWDKDHDPEVISSSFNDTPWMDPRSPFYRAYWELYVDGALMNKTILNALGDEGSGYDIGNGLTNLDYNVAYPYTVLVGGTSISSSTTVPTDPTIDDEYWLPALAADPSTIWRLVAGGLTTLPTSTSDLGLVMETVWNQYYLNGVDIVGYSWGDFYDKGFQNNWTSSGGVDPSQPTPWYQTEYGLTPVTSDPWAQSGRGVPDVAANAGGNLNYKVPTADMTGVTSNGGTSAASPLWTALAAQINTIFDDQGLPQLGFMNDLLYVASAVAPASFNDVSVGGNYSSFYYDDHGPYKSDGGVQPTGYGYDADYGYDYVSGLGSPNGMVLARTLTAIAHAQLSSTAPGVMNVVDKHSGTSAVAQTLLVQNNYHRDTGVLVEVGGTAPVEMGSNSTYGWTSRLAEQVVQGSGFNSDLMPLLDGAAKSFPYQITVQAGDTLDVSADGHELALYQELLTNVYGFIQFGDDHGGITLARPVAVAQTAGGTPNQNAVVRIRQNGGDSTQLEIYEVDDYNGTVDGLAPGQAGYEQAAFAADYQLVGGGTLIAGPGQGNFTQVEIAGVDQGDILALKYTDLTTNDVYWAFSQANPGGVTALFNYGLNTWGFEDRPLTGDHDFNDLVVQIDFTSTAGHGLLVS